MPITTLLIDIALGLAIGLSLGMLGGGGSILTVPALVYVVGQTPQLAVTASLMIVGTNSLVGVFFHRSQGTLNWRVAFLFGGVGTITAFFAADLSKLFYPEVLMIFFAFLMLFVGAMLIFRKSQANEQPQSRGLAVTLLSGAGVGVLTGFLGVGGGFLIVPALVILVGLPMRQAIGTSLVIIAMNSLAGFLGHLGDIPIDFGIIIIFVVSGVIGTYIGTKLTKRFQPEELRSLFAIFVIVLALFLLYDNIQNLFAVPA